jgi:antirestriction protein ArdC
MNTLVAKTMDALIEKIESGDDRWMKGWRSGMPINASSGHHYRGMNVLFLWARAQGAGYTSNHWATYKQWGAMGHYVHKGEEGTPIIFFRRVEKEKDGETTSFAMARVSWVFNAAQVEGYAPKDSFEHSPALRHNRALEWLHVSGIALKTGDSPVCAFDGSWIAMPPVEKFASLDEYWSTVFHESVHWTGARGRLNRESFIDYGRQRPLEELTAEIGAAMLNASFGIDTIRNNAAYLKSWLEYFKPADKRAALYKAASQAGRAFEYFLPHRTEQMEEAA